MTLEHYDVREDRGDVDCSHECAHDTGKVIDGHLQQVCCGCGDLFIGPLLADCGKFAPNTDAGGLALFLYLLARDHLPLGVVEGIVADVEKVKVAKYSSPQLHDWAADTSRRLTARHTAQADPDPGAI